MRRLRPALVLALASSAGCYSYQPIQLSEISPNTSVRVQLSGMAVEQLRNGKSNEARLLEDFSVSGAVSRVTGDSVVLSVQTTQSSDAMTRPVTFYQPLPLARSDFRSVEVRKLDRKRTTITSVVLGALAVSAATYAIIHGGESSGTTPPNGGPNEARVPFLSFRIR
ncbi:MAG: hypothetical protein IT359_19585 [Gemmatimonadaceae bacterium]|nr:hypothetical protein [Gemmatimonadaceae bacterium]